jgi:hypothetical protein
MAKHRAAEISSDEDIDRGMDLTCEPCGDTGQVWCTHPRGGDKIENCLDCLEDINTSALVTCRGCVEWR